MKPRLASVMSRRRLLVGGLTAAAGVVVAACTGRTQTASTSSPSPSATVVATPACVVTPTETEGPYFVDERLNRSDITFDPTDGSARPGVPLTLAFTVSRVGSGGCIALNGAQIDVWHCDAAGVYSDVAANNSAGKRFLRGYQVTNSNGIAKFTTIYPGWYQGRSVHVHFKVRTFAGGEQKRLVVSGDNGTGTLLEGHLRDRPSNVDENRQSHGHSDLLGRADETGSNSLIPIGDASRGRHRDAYEGKSYADAGNQHRGDEDSHVVAFGRGSQEQEHPPPSTRVPTAIRVLAPSFVAIRAPMLETTMISTV